MVIKSFFCGRLTAKTVLAHLEKFEEFGVFVLPAEHTNCGRPRTPGAIREFAAHMVFVYRKAIPYHPMGNSQVESFVKPLKSICRVLVFDSSWYFL